MNQPIIKVKNLNVKIGSHLILEDINFEIYAGESIAVIGPNGSGKTVLFKTLLNLFPYEGEIWIDPTIKIGYVPQHLNLDPYLKITIQELLTIKKKILKISDDNIKEIFKIINLKEHCLFSKITDLSGGDLQKALIAFALLGEPELLLFDEPTANIDLPGESSIYESLEYFQHLKKFTLILISHDLNVVNKHSHRIICINKHKVCDGTTEQMLEPEILKKLFGEKAFHHHFYHHPEIEKNHNAKID